MKDYSESTIYLNYLSTFLFALAFIYLGVVLIKKGREAKDLYHENNTYPEDRVDKELQLVLDRALGKPAFGMFQSICPRIYANTIASDPSSIENKFRQILSTDEKTKYYFENDKIKKLINPLYFAYMRIISRRMFSRTASSQSKQADALVYAASSVDIITPLLLLMASPSKKHTVYMVDINPEICNFLNKTRDAFFDPSIQKKLPEKIIERFYRQFYLLSEYDYMNINQKTSPHLILALILQLLEVKNIIIINNKLSFSFQGRDISFEFIHADITNLNSCNYLQQQLCSQPYVYIAKASIDLLHSAYLPALFKKLGHPSFCFISTERLNKNFNNQMLLWINTHSNPSRENVLQAHFLPNDCGILEEVRHPLLRRLHQAIIQICRANRGQEVTPYHLPTLHQ